MALPFFPPSFTLGILTLPLMKKSIQWNEHFHLFPSYQIPGMYRGDSTRATQMCVETAMYRILRARFFVQTLHSLRPAISRGNSPQLFVDCRAAKHLPGQPRPREKKRKKKMGDGNGKWKMEEEGGWVGEPKLTNQKSPPHFSPKLHARHLNAPLDEKVYSME